jgi:hypothetical protein
MGTDACDWYDGAAPDGWVPPGPPEVGYGMNGWSPPTPLGSPHFVQKASVEAIWAPHFVQNMRSPLLTALYVRPISWLRIPFVGARGARSRRAFSCVFTGAVADARRARWFSASAARRSSRSAGRRRSQYELPIGISRQRRLVCRSQGSLRCPPSPLNGCKRPCTR